MRFPPQASISMKSEIELATWKKSHVGYAERSWVLLGESSRYRRRFGRLRGGVAGGAPRLEGVSLRDAAPAKHARAPHRSAGGTGLQQFAQIRAGLYRALAIERRTAAARFAVAPS